MTKEKPLRKVASTPQPEGPSLVEAFGGRAPGSFYKGLIFIRKMPSLLTGVP